MTSKRIEELEKAERKLNALENGGVDNWEYYDVSLEQLRKDEEFEETIEGAFEDVLSALAGGVYEPSERGAGVAYSEDAERDALNIIKRLVYSVKQLNETKEL